VTIEIGGKPVFYDSYLGDGVNDDVVRMLCEMKYDIEEARQENYGKNTKTGILPEQEP
jgi:hypothetical protein